MAFWIISIRSSIAVALIPLRMCRNSCGEAVKPEDRPASNRFGTETLHASRACYKCFLFQQRIRPGAWGLAGDLPRRGSPETARAHARERRPGLAGRAVDAAEHDVVARVEARELARVEHADLGEARPRGAGRRGARGGRPVGDGVALERDRPAGPAGRPRGERLPASRRRAGGGSRADRGRAGGERRARGRGLPAAERDRGGGAPGGDGERRDRAPDPVARVPAEPPQPAPPERRDRAPERGEAEAALDAVLLQALARRGAARAAALDGGDRVLAPAARHGGGYGVSGRAITVSSPPAPSRPSSARPQLGQKREPRSTGAPQEQRGGAV